MKFRFFRKIFSVKPFYKDRAEIGTVVQPPVQHLWDACLDTISKIAEPESPFTQVGCYAQARIADPENQAARILQADALEQLGYQEATMAT